MAKAVKRKPLAKGTKVAIGVGIILLLGGIAYWLWKRRQPQADNTAEALRDAFNNLNFETGKDVILASSFPSLDELANVLLKAKNWNLKIIGHTDNQGSDAYNLDLSNRRALSVKRYLVGKGVTESMITTEGKGESQPLVGNDTKEGRAKNRRVEFLITKPDATPVASTIGLEQQPTTTPTTEVPPTTTTTTPPTNTTTPPTTNQ